MEATEMCIQKHASTLDFAMVTKGERGAVKKYCLGSKLVQLNCKKISSL